MCPIWRGNDTYCVSTSYGLDSDCLDVIPTAFKAPFLNEFVLNLECCSLLRHQFLFVSGLQGLHWEVRVREEDWGVEAEVRQRRAVNHRLVSANTVTRLPDLQWFPRNQCGISCEAPLPCSPGLMSTSRHIQCLVRTATKIRWWVFSCSQGVNFAAVCLIIYLFPSLSIHRRMATPPCCC